MTKLRAGPDIAEKGLKDGRTERLKYFRAEVQR
jgi:hypothetical protein